MALVPAICEVFSIPFIGPERLMEECCVRTKFMQEYSGTVGFYTPKFVLLKSADDLDCLEHMETPYVLKPVMEGSSIGLRQKNIINASRVSARVSQNYF